MPAAYIENPYYRPPSTSRATTPAPIAPYPQAPRPPRPQAPQPWATISEAFPSPPEDREPAYKDIRRYRQPMSEREYGYELQYLSGRAEEYENKLGGLNQLVGRMDPIGKERVKELNKKTDRLQRAFSDGRINQLELFREMNVLSSDVDSINWSARVQGPGAQPGDVWEEDGMVMQNIAGKGKTAIDYTEQYRRDHTYTDEKHGITIIPTMPGKESRIIHRSEYLDDNAIKDQESTIRKAFNDQVKLLSDIYKHPITGELTKSIEEIRDEAEEAVSSSESRIRRAAAKAYGREGDLTPNEQQTTVEEEMRGKGQYGGGGRRRVAPPQIATPISPPAAAQAIQPTAKSTEVLTDLTKQHLKSFGIPEVNLGRAQQRGYNQEQVVKALGALNQMRNQFPNVNSPEELPAEWQPIFAEAYKVLTTLKGK